MTLEQKKELFNQFSCYVSAARAEKIQKVAYKRTRLITTVLEDVNQSHNISAVLRSCDCFGIQDVHIIEQRHKYAVNQDICKGANQWLDIYRYNSPGNNNTEECFNTLREKGYTLVATTPRENNLFIDELPVDTKIALIFGTEEAGLSPYALSNADAFVKIPMYGFTESFNISVSAALCLYELTKRLRKANNLWQLSEEAIIDLQLDWLGRTTHRYGQIKALLEIAQK